MVAVKKITIFITVLIIILGTGCDQTPDITDTMLDSEYIYDPSIDHPENYLLSYALPNPTPDEANKPVFIAIHGYSATTFEWEDFRTWLSANGNNEFYLSMVLLGGHGTTYEDFKNATWHDWQKPITDEYDRLVQAGYTNINFVGSSTSCTLIIDLLHSDYLTKKVIPENIFFVDPIIIPSTKSLSMVPLLGPVMGYVESDNTAEEDTYWYHYRPQETLQQLNKLLNRVRKQLEDGVKLPSGCKMKVYKSIHDPTADPVSAVLIYKGIKTDNGPIDVEMIESNLHVFTRLSLRDGVTSHDIMNQEKAFADFIARVM